ncbi:MAG: ferrochelatase [Anaerolineales bacterium]|nr:ferrochelatase [Anaerolineales bacterium]
MAYGGPNSLDDVEPYLLDVRHYRQTSQEIVDEVRERYREIGGRSPILERTRAQANALESELNSQGEHIKVFVGMRHWYPFISQALADMSAAGIQKAVGLVMAPHYSRMSVGAYFKKVQEAEIDLEIAPIERWHLLPGYLDALAGRVHATLERFPAEVRTKVPIIFTAHSLPERILEWGDSYPDELNATVIEVVKRLNSNPYEFAFQSAAISNEPWLGPDAGDVIVRLSSEGHKHVLISPIGFVCEHVEVLYDVDIVFKRQASSLGMQLERIEMLNTSPEMIAGLAELVRDVAKEKKWL